MKIQFKKMQNGGSFAPFLSSYTPTLANDTVPDPVLQYLATIGTPGSEATSKSTTKSSNSGGIDVKDTMSLLKDMRGLDNDVTLVSNTLAKQAQRDQLFGTGDPVVQYYQNIQLVNKVIESKEEYSKAYDQAKAQGALSEAAISSDGKVVVKTSRGDYSLVTPDQALLMQKKGIGVIQKNQDLLNDRRHNSKMAFQNGVLNIVQNSTSFKSIKDTIDAIVSNLGKSSVTQEGYTTKEGNQIVAGIRALKDAGTGTMNGVYKITSTNETQEAQAQMAVDAIYRNLNDAQKAYLKLNSNGKESGAFGLIKEIVMGKTSSTKELKTEYQKNMDALGNAKSSKTDENGNPIDDVDTDPAIAFALGYGTRLNFPIHGKKGQVGLDISANSIAMLDDSGKPMSIATLGMLGSGRLGGMMDLNHASMNGAMITPDAVNKIVLDGGRTYATDLPVDQQALSQGIIKPDLNLLKKIEQVNNSQLGSLKTIPQDKLTPQQKQQINNIYRRNGIQAKYDQNGNLTASYHRFMLVNGTASQKAFANSSPQFTYDAQEASDDARKSYETNIQKLTDDKKFKLDSGWFSNEKVYQGTIFIPFNNNYVDYYTGSGIKMNSKELHGMETAQQHRDYLMRQYNNPGSLIQ